MSEHEPLEGDALPDDVMQLVSGARRAASAEGPGDEARARMRARLAAALPLGLPPGSGPGGGGASAPTPPTIPPEGTMATPASGLLARIPAWIAAATFVLGVGTGAVLVPRLAGENPTHDPMQSAVVNVATTATATATPIAAGTEAAPTVNVSDLPRVALPSSSATSATSAPTNAPAASAARASTSDLTAERSLLDVARTALGRGDFTNALASVDAHQKRFPKGALVEEREALAVQALAGAGRHDEARARSDRFARAFPGSILLPAVEAAGGGK